MNRGRGLFFATLLLSTLMACAPSSDSTGGSSTGGATPTPTPGPTYGMDCTTTNGGDLVSTYPISYIETISGSTITSVQFMMKRSDGSAGTTINTPMTLAVYKCVTAGAALPTATETASATGHFNNSYSAITFTISSGSVPTNCTSGQIPLAFKLTDSTGSTSTLYGASAAQASTCGMKFSGSTTQVTTTIYRSWATTISATQ